jgi:hypothetical protein
VDRHEFENRLKVLHSLDRHELVEAGLGHMADDRHWVAFREKPAAWLLNAEDHNAAAVWALVESRCAPVLVAGDNVAEIHLLEPGSRDALPDAITSAAISLKRIADVLTGDNQNSGLIGAMFDIAASRR